MKQQWKGDKPTCDGTEYNPETCECDNGKCHIHIPGIFGNTSNSFADIICLKKEERCNGTCYDPKVYDCKKSKLHSNRVTATADANIILDVVCLKGEKRCKGAFYDPQTCSCEDGKYRVFCMNPSTPVLTLLQMSFVLKRSSRDVTGSASARKLTGVVMGMSQL